MTLNNILTVEYPCMTRTEKRAYIQKNGELKVLTTHARGGWDDIQFDAYKLGCNVYRELDADLRAAYKFCEYYHFIPKT